MKVFALDHNSIMKNALVGFEIVNDPLDAERIVLWTDQTSEARGLLQLARYNNIPSIVIQHGRRGSSRYFAPFYEPILADKHLVWGDDDKTALVQAGHSPNKIFVTGTPIFKHLKERKPHEGINVVFCPEHWDREVDENIKTLKVLKKNKKWNVIPKIIEVHDPKLYPNAVISHRDSPDHLDICTEVLSTADIVVGVSESTFELLAQAMNIPVVIMETWAPKAFGGDHRYAKGYRRPISNASKTANLINLNKVVADQLNNPNELQKERWNICISEGGRQLDAVKEIQKRIIG